MKDPAKAISLQEELENPESFNGELYVTKNGVPELFITTADCAQELAEIQQECEQKALVKLVTLATQDITAGKTHSLDDALVRLRKARA